MNSFVNLLKVLDSIPANVYGKGILEDTHPLLRQLRVGLPGKC
ncbi:hypothetical protein ACVXHB_29995 [Escherichia coli]